MKFSKIKLPCYYYYIFLLPSPFFISLRCQKLVERKVISGEISRGVIVNIIKNGIEDISREKEEWKGGREDRTIFRSLIKITPRITGG